MDRAENTDATAGERLDVLGATHGAVAAPTEAEQSRLRALKHFQDDMSASMRLQGTRPQTLAHALAGDVQAFFASLADQVAPPVSSRSPG